MWEASKAGFTLYFHRNINWSQTISSVMIFYYSLQIVWLLYKTKNFVDSSFLCVHFNQSHFPADCKVCRWFRVERMGPHRLGCGVSKYSWVVKIRNTSGHNITHPLAIMDHCIIIAETWIYYIQVSAIIMQYFSYLDKNEVLQQEYSHHIILPSPHFSWVVNCLSLSVTFPIHVKFRRHLCH